MINSYFKECFPFAYVYFTSLLDLVFENKRKFAQSIIFEGADTKNQYLFALELARILNCKKDKTPSCDCADCRWVRSFSHPCVNNVSQIHFKPDDDETKTVISTRQAREIEKNLSLSSEYHRFFIFFSSREYDYGENELECFRALNFSDKINFSIEPLTYSSFHPKTLNALLKSIEEPPENTTFIFLTKSKEDILPTIVSRSLVFKLSGKKIVNDYNDIIKLIPDYFNINYNSAFDISDSLQNYIKENSIALETLLNSIIEYLKDLLIQNMENEQVVQKIKKDIDIINTSIKYSKASMSDKIVLDTTFLRIARGY